MMKKALKFGSPVLTITLFAVAGILLLGSSIGGARAALTYYSETYSSQIKMQNIGVALYENGALVSNQDYGPYADGDGVQDTGKLLGYLKEDESFQIGRSYDERIAAKNTGDIDEYVRISLYTYWLKDGEKLTELSPELIELNTVNESDWLLDEDASTWERKVFYYSKVLRVNEFTSDLTDKLTINGEVADKATIEESPGGDHIKVTYDYDGVEFAIEAVVDAVQTHNAEDAIWSAWGRRVSVNNGRLKLN